jgi:glycosyltransferase involved in cell wall biosynthesis
MFLGKIEYEKGAGEFVDAFLRARNLIPNQLHALIIGTGSLLGGLRSKVVACSADNEFTFIERLPHSEVATALAKSDIYVSLNRLGNLSNANLEAMRAGCCMVIPASQPSTSVDVITDQLVPSDAICRVPSVDDVESLSGMLVFLSKHPEKRKAIGNRIQERSSEFLVTWDLRVQRELELVTRLACESSQA